MTETADVVVVGAGVVGSSIAFHLSEAGCTNVVVVEREPLQGLGSTGKATGGVRAQFGTDINILMSMYSIDFLARFEEATGGQSGYDPQGYLFIATSESHLSQLHSNMKRQIALGLRGVQKMTAQDISILAPKVRVDDVLGGTFCQSDGFVDPLGMMDGFMSYALDRGVRLRLGTGVIAIDIDSGGIAGVRTTQGTIPTRCVVNAAGAWSASVAELVGIDLPVKPLRRQLVGTKPFGPLPFHFPMIVDTSNGFHFRPHTRAGVSRGLLLAWPDPDESPGFNTDFDPSFIEKVMERAVKRVPCLRSVEVEPRRCRAGLYEVTPDHHAIIGEAPDLAGFFLANGFSGHGVMHAPATGRIVSDLILNRRPGIVDVDALSPGRFARSQQLSESAIL